MINSTQFDMQADVLATAQNSGLATNPDDFGSLKRMNPNYIEKWYELFQRYNGCEATPVNTGYQILECYSVTKENLKTGLRSENITVSLRLAAVPGVIPENTYLQLKLWGPGIEMVQPYQQKKRPSASFISFCQMVTAKYKTPFERFLNLTVGSSKSNWKELRCHYPDLIGTTGIVSFIATGSYNGNYTYSAYFFDPAKDPSKMPLSSTELILGKHKEPECDFIGLQRVLQEAYNSFAGIKTIEPDTTVPQVPASQSSAIPSAPEAPKNIGAAPAFGSAQATDENDEIPFQELI